MKYRLKEINCNQFVFNKTQLNTGTICNIKYNNEPLEFQTPKLLIQSLVKENDNEYLILKILPTQACKTFCSKIQEIEACFTDTFGEIKSVFKEDLVTIKIPFKYSKPLVKLYKDESLFNYYAQLFYACK